MAINSENTRGFSIKSFFLLLLSFLFYHQAATQTKEGQQEDPAEGESPKVKYKIKKPVFNYNSVFSVYPFQPAINYMTLGYEFKTGEKTAFKTLAGIASKENSVLGIGNISNYSAYKIEMQFKYFMNKKAAVFNGIYIAPFVLFKSCKFTYDGQERIFDSIFGSYRTVNIHKTDKANAFHLGFILGYHLLLGERFTLDMFAGEGLMSASGNYKYGSRVFDIYANEIRMKLGLSIGFGF